MMRVLVLHAYSSENAGDGLLVRETLELIREALGQSVDFTMLASRPGTFSDLGIRVHHSVPGVRGYDRDHIRTLKTINDFDLVVGVGGGYLRTGSVREALKTVLVQGPQLWAASRTSAPTIYLPQSVGPAKFATRRPLRSMLEKINEVHMRDDRSIRESGGKSSVRRSDLAASRVLDGRQPGRTPAGLPVISIRAVRGAVSPAIYRLLGDSMDYDAYIQSTTGGNDDRPATATLRPTRVIERSELMTAGGTPRVVIAVRLHAALMALAAGHYVIHLAYERKGFGAYEDLGLAKWVHNVNSFDETVVRRQISDLMTTDLERSKFDDALQISGPRLTQERANLVSKLRSLAHGVRE